MKETRLVNDEPDALREEFGTPLVTFRDMLDSVPVEELEAMENIANIYRIQLRDRDEPDFSASFGPGDINMEMNFSLDAAVSGYDHRNPESKKLHEEAVNYMPGGNTRTLLHAAPFPISIRKGHGCKLYDVDGHEYIDFVGELTAGLFGHSNQTLFRTLSSTLQDIGLSLGATTPYERRYAQLLCDRFGLERVRFTNSGTEANLHCLAAARRFTGRKRTIAFRGGYHGGVLSFGTGVAPNTVDGDSWVVVQYNDIHGLRQAFEEHKDEIAAVIVEGIQGSVGFIEGKPEFLKAVGELAKEHGAIFILDEVMTSRLAVGGLKSTLDVKPDMITLGKYLGGGMPFGAFGGRHDIMAVYDPRGPNAIAHSGTFQNNTLMLTAGYTGLHDIYTSDAVRELNARGERLRGKLRQLLDGTRLLVTGRGSLLCIHATKTVLRVEDVTCKDDILAVEWPDLKRLFWMEMLEAGFWVHVRGSMALSLPMTDAEMDKYVDAVAQFCQRQRRIVQVEEPAPTPAPATAE